MFEDVQGAQTKVVIKSQLLTFPLHEDACQKLNMKAQSLRCPR